MAEYFIRGLTAGTIAPPEIINWADDLIVASARTEDWMLDLSTSSADDRMGVLHYLHAVKGDVDETVLAHLLAKS